MPDTGDEFPFLAEKLLRSGVAPKHVERLLGELESHQAALLEEESNAGRPIEQARASARERLGSDEMLIRSVTARPELLSWGARQPLLTCALGPLLVLVMTAAAFLLLAAAFIGGAHMFFPNSSPQRGPLVLVRDASLVFLALVQYVAPIVCCAVFAWYAATRRLKLTWVLVGVGLTAILGATWNLNLHWAEGIDRGSIGAGIGFSTAGPAPAVFAGRCLSAIVVAMLTLFFQRRLPVIAGRSRT